MDTTIHNILASKSDYDPTSGCLVWRKRFNRNGYGLLNIGDRKALLAHRVAYEQWVGPLYEHEIVRHRCDNPSCIRPHHLTKGTQLENMHDMLERHGSPVRKGRLSARCINAHVMYARNVGRRASGARYCLTCNRSVLQALAAEVGEVLL